MIMGGGVEYDVGGNTAINLGIQYSNGLTDVTDIDYLDEKSVFNSLRIVLGVMF
jgi:opacity protein-like surface antigen